jgi:hypothetical protein
MAVLAAWLGLAVGAGIAGPTAGSPGLVRKNAPPTASTAMPAAVARRMGVIMGRDIHGARNGRR